MRSTLARLLLIPLLLAPLPAAAQEPPPSPPPSEPPSEPAPRPRADADAGTFKPSEEVSPDQEVDFPADL